MSCCLNHRRAHLAFALTLFVLALLPRVLTLDAFITWDEPMWMFRSGRFLNGLIHARWADTAPTGHPGVTTMWAGALGGALYSAAHPDAGWALAALTASGGLDVQDTDALRLLGQFLPWARMPVAVVTALAVAAYYCLIRRLLDFPTALLAALLLAFDPFFSRSFPSAACGCVDEQLHDPLASQPVGLSHGRGAGA